MEIHLKPSSLDELDTLNILYDSACSFFKSIDPAPQGTPPEICITKGCLPPNGIYEDYRIMSIYYAGELVGYCDFYLGHPDDKTAYISFLYIDESYRKKGIAAMAIGILFGHITVHGCERVRLTVSLKNWIAIRFWVKNGFNKITMTEIETGFGIDRYGAMELEKDISGSISLVPEAN